MYGWKLLVVLLAAHSICASNRGFILTAPKRLLAGSIEMVCLSLHNTTGPADVSLDLLHSASDEKISFTQHRMTRDSECIELPVYPTPEQTARLQLQVKFDEMFNYSINSVQEVLIQQNPLVILIQTDKPVYKPGQLVQFRLLTLTHDLKPVILPLEKVWIESPSDVRLAQWTNLKTQQGLVHLDFQLSQEPILGMWKIKVVRNNSDVEVKTFEVREYVLPRFEVTITPPDYILADSNNLTWNICAKYSYGQPVKGRVHIDVRPKYSEWIPVCNNDAPTTKAPIAQVPWTYDHCRDPPMGVNVIIPLDGCVLFNVTGAEIGFGQLSKHNDPLHTVVLTAIVTEANTEIERNATTTSSILHEALNIEFLPHTAQYFKPYLPYQGKLRVVYPKSKPAEGKLILVCVKSRNDGASFMNQEPIGCRNFTSDSQGFVHFTLPPQEKNINLILTATAVEYETQFYSPDMRWHVKMVQPTAQLDVQGWYSPSNSFIEVSDDGLRIPRCNYHHTFRVQFTKPKNGATPTFYYLVKARGDLVQFNRVHPVAVPRRSQSDNIISINNSTIGIVVQNVTQSDDMLHTVDQFGIKLLISPKMSPISQLLVYYVREDGETVASAHTINIKQCFPNKVSAAWQQERQFPGAPAVFHLAAAPNSLCGISVVDKSTSFLVSNNPTKTDIVFNRLKAFHIDERSAPRESNVYNYCDSSDEYLRRRRRSYHPRFFMPPTISDAAKAFDDFGVVVMTDLKLKTKPCLPPPEYGYHYAPMLRSGKALSVPMDSSGALEDTEVAEIPTYEHASKAGSFDTEYAGSTAQAAVEIRSFFPETWLWELVDTGKDGRAKLRHDLPHTVTDWIGSAVCVSPQQGLGISSPTQITAFQPFFVELVLPYAVKRGEVVQLKVALYSFLSHSVPVRLTFEQSLGIELLSEESSASHCVEQHANWVHHYRIRATELGDVNLTISAEVDSSFPTPCGPETLISQRDVLIKPLLVKPEGFPVEITKSSLICTKDDDSSERKPVVWDLQLPSDVVDNSARAELNIVSDLMGPTLQNLGALVQLPMGCGEQNMVLFVPNLHVVNYLAATHQPNPKLQAEAVKNMEKGYQRELNYRHDDGSYSAFGKTDKEGSMWLTAFVVKTFAQARSHIFVDEKDLEISLNWISKHQLENGCFPVVGQVFHHDLRGGLSDDKMSSALTAYVLISLLETGLPLPPSLADNAKFCLFGDDSKNVYTKAVTTYALALLGDKEVAQESLNRLVELATIEHEMIYWQKSGSESRALNVEMTAYAILALVKLGGEENFVTAHKAVRWISQHRNANGGFVSTQDTVVALEALSKYSASLPTDNTDLNILVTANAVERHYHIGQQDRLLLKRQPLPVLPTHIEVIAHGSGCALVQSWLRYNVHTASGDEALELETNVVPTLSADRCSRQKLEFCVRYKPKGESSNMAVLEVSMASGYVPDKESLSYLDNSIHVKRWELQDDQVNFYFDSLSNNQLCLNFMVEQDTEVENPLPANVRLYDYYQPEMVISKSYQVATKCDTEPLPQPLPRSIGHFNDNSEGSDMAPHGFAVEPPAPYHAPLVNAIHEESTDTDNLIRVTKTRPRRRKVKVHGATTKNYSTPPPIPTTELQPTPTENLLVLTLLEENEIKEPIPTLPSVEETSLPIRLSTDIDLEESVDDPLQLITHDDSTVSTPLNENFVNVDNDLEFPDGIEGPSPVYVLPDDNTTNTLPAENENCPVCWMDFPSDFSSIYCNATAVYKAIQRKSDTMRLLLDLTPSKSVVRLRKLITIELHSSCLCLPLNEVNSTVLMTLEHSLDGRNELQLDSTANVWHVPSQQGPPEEVRQAKSQCLHNLDL